MLPPGAADGPLFWVKREPCTGGAEAAAPPVNSDPELGVGADAFVAKRLPVVAGLLKAGGAPNKEPPPPAEGEAAVGAALRLVASIWPVEPWAGGLAVSEVEDCWPNRVLATGAVSEGVLMKGFD
jgi:hypothetical protein